MTRRDYILISRTFASCKPSNYSPCLGLWQHIVYVFANALRAENQNFDEQRFVNDCSNTEAQS